MHMNSSLRSTHYNPYIFFFPSFKGIFWHLIPESQDSTLIGRTTLKNWKMQRAVTQIYSPCFPQMHYLQHQRGGQHQKIH